MSGYATGRRAEYDVIHDLQENGYETIRAASSKGVADVVAFKPGEALFVSVKRTNPTISPAERTNLLRVAGYVNGVPLVATRPLYKPLQYRRLTGPGPKDHTPWTPNHGATQ